MSSNDPSTRRILPQDAHNGQNLGMNSYTFAPQQFPQRETQKSEQSTASLANTTALRAWQIRLCQRRKTNLPCV